MQIFAFTNSETKASLLTFQFFKNLQLVRKVLNLPTLALKFLRVWNFYYKKKMVGKYFIPQTACE